MAGEDKDNNGHDGLAEGPEGDKPMSFLDHVGELRSRLIRMVAAIGLGFFASFYFAPHISQFLRIPLDDAWKSAGMEGIAELQALAIQDPLMVDVRVAVTAGIFLTAPYLFLQLWLFIAPGLFAKEKRFAVPFVITSMIMFLIGAAFAFEVVLPFVYEWMIDYSHDRGESIQLELHNYFKGTTRVLLAFGLVFEFPLLVAFLAKAGVVTEKTLMRFWKIAVLVMFIVAGILTPPEPVSQVLMAGPMVVLYFISIGVAKLINPASKIEAALAEYDEPDEPDEHDEPE
ncbi:twin-arginine translocase subunit TatC [Enhygromyxa salina]|uniref:Sec-independent protein translocase protein TatC n=1 Tax=Enhygromyxa salina TaxID=215803 RepID=A0A2S9YWZ7_9BACT|nr:twin-arginine translocase subunit TatC [Enhygromyxa salina]PRQ09603.1 Sec-independent protein translocase protein TatCy [Enhygromyxa salina]